MKFEAGNILLQELMDRFKIPSNLAGRNILPPEMQTRTVVRTTQIPLVKGTVEVKVEDIDSWVNPESDLFELNGQMGAVYLHTSYSSSWDIEELAKWHVTKCSTLTQQIKKGSLHERYALKKSEVMDDEFVLTLLDSGKTIRRKLRPCKNCLAKLSKMKPRWRVANSYRFTEYAAEFGKESNLISIGGGSFSETPKPNIYNLDFKERANSYKKLHPYCNSCNKSFALNYLEVHHINRLKYDDRSENWAVLCVTCHIYEHRSDNRRMKAMYEANGRLESFYCRYPEKRSSPLS